MKVTILGCGGSGGVPLAGSRAGGDWGRCDPNNPKNRRRRVSIWVEAEGLSLLVDTSPDLRLQMLDADITKLDAVLFSHAHGDHCHGIDDLRWMVFARKAPIPAYMDTATQKSLTQRFAYAFESSRNPDSLYRALLEDIVVQGTFAIDSLEITPFTQGHGAETTLGYRFGKVAYSTDVVALNEAALAALEGIEVWIVDCLRFEPHPTHAHFDQVLEWVAKVKPSLTVLTHMNHTVDYDEIAARCPAGVVPAFDGMVIEI